MEDRFGERASIGTLITFIKRFAQYYAPTERLVRQRLLQSPFVHVDETLLTIEGTEQ
jgi:hypothetical protein